MFSSCQEKTLLGAQQEFQKLCQLVNQAPLSSSSSAGPEVVDAVQYVEQLEEQNYLLVKVMSDLQNEIDARVGEMERRLHSSAKTTMETVINFQECKDLMRRLVNERLSMESALLDMQHKAHMLAEENAYLREQNVSLRNDVHCLLNTALFHKVSDCYRVDNESKELGSQELA